MRGAPKPRRCRREPASPLPLRAGVRRLLSALTCASGSGRAEAAATLLLLRARPFLGPSPASSSSSSAGTGGFAAALWRRLEARGGTCRDPRARA